MALYEPQTGDRTIGPFQLAASSTHRGHLQAPQPVRQRQHLLLRGAGRCEPCSADAGDYKTGRPPADQSPRWRARPPASSAGRRQNPHLEPPEVLALSPERGGAPDRCGGS